jgi:hypothetical protein
MTRMRLWYLSGTIWLILCIPLLAQHQRLGLMPEEPFTLEPKGRSHVSEAFCLDEQLRITEQPVRYSQVISEGSNAQVRLGDGPPIPLQRAIDEGLISVEGASDKHFDHGTGISVRFKNLTDKSVTISLVNGLAFGEQKGALIQHDSPALELLNKPLGRFGSGFLQMDLWDKLQDERRLQTLGFYPNSLVVNPDNTRAAVTNFQIANGITPANGLLNEATSKSLEDKSTEFATRLGSIGFERGAFAKLDDAVRKYQTFMGEKPTGVLNVELESRLRADELTLAAIKELRSAKGSADIVLGNGTFPSVLTFAHSDDATMILVSQDDRPELWSITDYDAVTRARPGADSLRHFSEKALTSQLPHKNANALVIKTGVFKKGGSAPLRVNGVSSLVPENELQSFLNGSGKLSTIDKAIEVHASQATTTPLRVIVERSPVQQGRMTSGTLDSFGYSQVDKS